MLYGMAAMDGILWVASTYEKALFGIDPKNNAVVARIDLGIQPYQVIAIGQELWVSSPDAGALKIVKP